MFHSYNNIVIITIMYSNVIILFSMGFGGKFIHTLLHQLYISQNHLEFSHSFLGCIWRYSTVLNLCLW